MPESIRCKSCDTPHTLSVVREKRYPDLEEFVERELNTVRQKVRAYMFRCVGCGSSLSYVEFEDETLEELFVKKFVK